MAVPPGLEYLSTIDGVWVVQINDVIEMVVPVEMANKYKINNSQGQQIFFAVEESNVFNRQAMGTAHPFRINIIDNFGRVVFYIDRPWTCGCWDDRVSVHLFDGSLMGSINQEGCCNVWFNINGPDGQPVFKMKGPPCGMECCGEATFDVLPLNSDKPIGQIRKVFAGAQEFFTDADTFGLQFPYDLDVRLKATLLGAVFLIDFMFYEVAANQKKDHHSHGKGDSNSHKTSKTKTGSGSGVSGVSGISSISGISGGS